MMLKQVNKDLVDEDGVDVRYPLDDNLFNLSYAAFKLTPRPLRGLSEFLFADDATLVAHSERALQCITSCFANAAKLFGLEVSVKKTEVPPGRIPPASHHYQRNQAEVSAAFLLPGLYHVI